MKRKKGFTLIELLVVIAIIALLLSVILPSLRKAKEHAGLISCASNQHQIVTAVNSYAADWNSKLPPRASNQRPSILHRYKNSGDPKTTPTYESLGSYLPEGDVLNCPLSSFAKGQADVGGRTYAYQDLYQNPSVCEDGQYVLNCSYQLLWNTMFPADKGGAEIDRFVGPGKDSHNKLLIADVLLYSHGMHSNNTMQTQHWYSSHRFGDSAKESGRGMVPYYGRKGSADDFNTDAALRKIRLNAGYIDGRVERFISKDTYRISSGVSTFQLPKTWY